jgi:preprotein translocase subunit SecY
VAGVAFLMASASLSGRQAFSRGLSFNDLVSALLWFVGTFCFMIVWVFLRAKTKKRTLTISENGIYTEIGGMKANYPWQRLKEIKDLGQYLLVVTSIGNAFFIPLRAFADADQRTLFVEEIDHYRAAQ